MRRAGSSGVSRMDLSRRTQPRVSGCWAMSEEGAAEFGVGAAEALGASDEPEVELVFLEGLRELWACGSRAGSLPGSSTR